MFGEKINKAHEYIAVLSRKEDPEVSNEQYADAGTALCLVGPIQIDRASWDREPAIDVTSYVLKRRSLNGIYCPVPKGGMG